MTTTRSRPLWRLIWARPSTSARELARKCDRLDELVPYHEAALAAYQHRGELNQVRRMQRELGLDQHERDTLHRLLAALDERFPPPGRNPRVRATV